MQFCLLKGKVVGTERLWIMTLVVRFLSEQYLSYRHSLAIPPWSEKKPVLWTLSALQNGPLSLQLINTASCHALSPAKDYFLSALTSPQTHWRLWPPFPPLSVEISPAAHVTLHPGAACHMGAPLLVCARWFLEVIGLAVNPQCYITNCSNKENFSSLGHSILHCWCCFLTAAQRWLKRCGVEWCTVWDIWPDFKLPIMSAAKHFAKLNLFPLHSSPL